MGMTSQRRVADTPGTIRGAPRTIELKDWGVHHCDDPYAAPEIRGIMVSGVVHKSNTRKIKKGQCILTSKIVSTKGRVLETESGSFYVLVGDPIAAYAAWLKDQKIRYNSDRPVILHTGKTRPGRRSSKRD